MEKNKTSHLKHNKEIKHCDKQKSTELDNRFYNRLKTRKKQDIKSIDVKSGKQNKLTDQRKN